MDILLDLRARGLVQDTTDMAALNATLQSRSTALYYGCDPSADSLQVGNLIGLLVLRRFAQAGHRSIALAGGATGMIGDPGGRSTERNLLDRDTLAHNLGRIANQLRDISGVELVNNLDWTEPVSALTFLREVGEHASVRSMMARETVKARIDTPNSISFTEFSYQLLQAFDYLHLFRTEHVELQVGGSDQWGNILAGVDLIRRAEGATVHAFTWPLLLRADGQKFGKSEKGAVWLAADRTPPEEFYRYWLNVADEDVEPFLLRLTLLPVDECRRLVSDHLADPTQRTGQRRLAREITALVHSPEVATELENGHWRA